MSTRDNIYENDYYKTFSKKSSKIQRDNTKHYPNKDEARVLRQIMASTGLSEEEVRSHHKYRKMLSEAQKSGRERKWLGKQEVFYKSLLKKACKETGLVPQHPDTLVVLQCLIDEKWNKQHWYRPSWISWTLPLKAETVVKKYAK